MKEIGQKFEKEIKIRKVVEEGKKERQTEKEIFSHRISTGINACKIKWVRRKLLSTESYLETYYMA
jgi:hypothetical protein